MKLRLGLTGLLAGVIVLASAFTGKLVANAATGNDTIQNMPAGGRNVIVDYDVTQIESGKLVDISGKGNDAIVVGSGVNSVDGALVISGQDSYLTLPMSIMSDLTDREQFTIEAVYSRTGGSSAAWLFNIGSIPKSIGTNYLFFCPQFFGGSIRAGIKNATNESLIDSGVSLSDNQDYTVILSFNHGRVTVKIDDNEAESVVTDNSIMADVIIPGTENDILGYIGRSCWSADAKFNGIIKSFKIYDDAFGQSVKSPAEILADKGFRTTTSLDIKTGSNAQIAVMLPEGIYKGYDAAISYNSNNPDIAVVDQQSGRVTGVKAGIAKIVTTVTVGDTIKTADTTVTVTESNNMDPDELIGKAAVYKNYFDDNDLADSEAVIGNGLARYTGELQYDADGLTGSAIVLGDYGLKLNRKNLGTDFTVSMWVKPRGILPTNSPILFLGYHDPENWLGVVGNNDSEQAKIWTRMSKTGILHTTLNNKITAPANEWTMLTLVSDGSAISFYQNGVLLTRETSAAAAAAADVLNGKNQDIYIGVNLWDPMYRGLVDNVRVYDTALASEDINTIFVAEAEDSPGIKSMLNEKASKIRLKDIISEGDTSEDVKYNLNLFTSISGSSVIWTTSNLDIINNEGKVCNPTEDTEVLLRAVVTNGAAYSDPIEIIVTVKALDRNQLNEAIKNAGMIDQDYLAKESAERLHSAVESVKRAKTQSEIRDALDRLKRVIESLEYRNGYKNLWSIIETAAPVKMISLKINESQNIFTLPEAVKGAVNVSFVSGDTSVVSFVNGVVKAIKSGKATVSVIIRAKDGWVMEYTTVVQVIERGNVSAVAKAVLVKGKTTKITVTAPSDVSIVYAASGAVSVSGAGVIKGKKAGNGTITVTFIYPDGHKVTKQLKVKVGEIRGKASAKKGQTLKLKVKGIPGQVKWSVSKKSYATITKKGKLKAKKAGKVVVRAKVGGVVLKKMIKIKK